MINASAALGVIKKPVVLLGAVTLIALVLVWLLAFFSPQSHKLAALQAQKSSLQQTVLQDQARLLRVRAESHHVGQIRAIDTRLQGYVPASEDLYTYIQTLSSAGNRSGVSIVSLEPSLPVPAAGTSYDAVPITANVKGTYDHLVAFISAVYELPRLTDINGLTISGGGPGTNRTTTLTATFDLVIFMSQKVSSS